MGVIMGSTSDWETMEHAAKTLEELGVSYETRVISAHRTPDLLFEYAATAEQRGIRVIIAGAGGAAHLPGIARGEDDGACSGCACRQQVSEGCRFAAFDRADAQGRARRDVCDR